MKRILTFKYVTQVDKSSSYLLGYQKGYLLYQVKDNHNNLLRTSIFLKDEKSLDF